MQPSWANQISPSGPEAIPNGYASVKAPSGISRIEPTADAGMPRAAARAPHAAPSQTAPIATSATSLRTRPILRTLRPVSEPLREQDVDPDPLRQFAAWFAAAEEAGVAQPEAAALGTVGADGAPSVRMVLVKGVDERGFRFFTNYASRKGRELSANPHAALAFYWQQLGRQVRITGLVARTAREESVAYAHSRSRGSQLSALASAQSSVIDGRPGLEARVAELSSRYEGEELPVSEEWGGFTLAPGAVELWQQRADRLHDRLLYTRGDRGWRLERLAP